MWLGLIGGVDYVSEIRYPAPTAAAAPPAAAAAAAAPTAAADADASRFACPHCPKVMSTFVNLTRHCAKEHAGLQAPTEASVPPPVSAPPPQPLHPATGIVDSGETSDGGMVEFHLLAYRALSGDDSDVAVLHRPILGLVQCAAMLLLQLAVSMRPTSLRCVCRR